MKTRVVLVDDHALFRAGVRGELGDRVDILGEAASVAEAVPLIVELDPEVVLLDVHLPDGGGEAVIAGVSTERPGVKFLALSVSDAAEDVISVIRAGARGYVTKTISGEELADAVNRVAAGDAVFSPRLAGFVLDAFRAGERVYGDAELEELTAREREVLQLIARGYRRAPAPLGEDNREPRVERAAKAAALLTPRAHSLGRRAASDLVHRLLLRARSMSRFASRSTTARRLSRTSLPRASASSTFTRPSLK
jgi:DNA-binding NarL/FixJ family response regulator